RISSTQKRGNTAISSVQHTQNPPGLLPALSPKRTLPHHRIPAPLPAHRATSSSSSTPPREPCIRQNPKENRLSNRHRGGAPSPPFHKAAASLQSRADTSAAAGRALNAKTRDAQSPGGTRQVRAPPTHRGRPKCA